MAADFAARSQLVRPGRPHIRFLSIGPRFCSTLLSGPAWPDQDDTLALR